MEAYHLHLLLLLLVQLVLHEKLPPHSLAGPLEAVAVSPLSLQSATGQPSLMTLRQNVSGWRKAVSKAIRSKAVAPKGAHCLF